VSLINFTLNQARKFVVFVIGITVIFFGVLLIFLPGPAILVIPIGLLILSTEFVWAKRFLKSFKSMISKDDNDKSD